MAIGTNLPMGRATPGAPERSAHRLSHDIVEGELVIRIHVPCPRHAADTETMVSLEFDDGLEPIVVPWSELDLALVPVRRSR